LPFKTSGLSSSAHHSWMLSRQVVATGGKWSQRKGLHIGAVLPWLALVVPRLAGQQAMNLVRGRFLRYGVLLPNLRLLAQRPCTPYRSHTVALTMVACGTAGRGARGAAPCSWTDP
jgi:hypothetical protein